MLNTKLFQAYCEDPQPGRLEDTMTLSIKEVLGKDPKEFEEKIFFILDPSQVEPVDKMSGRFFRLKLE